MEEDILWKRRTLTGAASWIRLYSDRLAIMLPTIKDGKWDEGTLTTDPNVTLNECAGVFQYAQTVFEGMKAYTTEDGQYCNVPSGPQRRATGRFCKKTGDAGIPRGSSFVDAVVADSQGK